jgi:hypothetical protein
MYNGSALLNGNGRRNGNGTSYGGTVSLQAAQSETSSTFGGGMERTSEYTDLREALSFYFRSFLWDPRFMTFRLFTNLARRSADSSSGTGSSRETVADATAYGASVSFFPQRRFHFSLFYSESDRETELDPLQFLSSQAHHTRYGGNFKLALSRLPRLRLDYKKDERERTGNVPYLRDDEHLSGNLSYDVKHSRFELDYDGYETFDELSLSLQENATWRLWNDNKLGKKHQVNFFASRSESAGEQPGFARSEAEFSTYRGQWSGTWSRKWSTTADASRSEGESLATTSEADSYHAGIAFLPKEHWNLHASARTSESVVNSTLQESVFESQSFNMGALWSRPRKVWSFSLQGGGGQSDSEMEQTFLLPPAPPERAQFDTRTWSAGGSIARAKGASSISLSSRYGSSEFDVEKTAGIAPGAELSTGYSKDIWRTRLEARKKYKKYGKLRGYLDYNTSERLLEDGTFAETKETSLNTFWNNHKWNVTAGYGRIESRALSGVETENTFLHAGANRRFKKHWSLRAYYNQSETIVGVLDPGKQRRYEASLDYSGTKLSLRFLAYRREAERGARQGESTSYSVMFARRFRGFL